MSDIDIGDFSAENLSSLSEDGFTMVLGMVDGWWRQNSGLIQLVRVEQAKRKAVHAEARRRTSCE